MKNIWCFVLLALVFLATGISAAKVPGRVRELLKNANKRHNRLLLPK
jgi:hypothetical protein